jgi:hypothetical protein
VQQLKQKSMHRLTCILHHFSSVLSRRQHPIIHFGAVNIAGSDLQEGFDLGTSLAFSIYRGPMPPRFLWFVRRFRKQLFNYEWMVVEQSSTRDDPKLTSNIRFDYTAFLNEPATAEAPVTSSFFRSGFCVRRF